MNREEQTQLMWGAVARVLDVLFWFLTTTWYFAVAWTNGSWILGCIGATLSAQLLFRTAAHIGMTNNKTEWDYRHLFAQTLIELNDQMRKAVNDGFRPDGDLLYVNKHYVQRMVK